MSLREELARKWWDQVQEDTTLVWGNFPTFDTITEQERNAWLKLANECLNQMEWARRECPMECGHCGRGEGPKALSLAPPDWQP